MLVPHSRNQTEIKVKGYRKSVMNDCVLIGRTNMKRAELTAFSEGDYFILINHSFATEWK